MSEETLSLKVPAQLYDRLKALAAKAEKSVDACLVQAVEEYVEHWEDYQRTCEALEAGADERVMLQVVNE